MVPRFCCFAELLRSVKNIKGTCRFTPYRKLYQQLENIGFVANMVSMVLYFGQVMLFYLSTSANTLTNFMGSTFLLSLVGAFISDTYLSRLSTCLLFGTIEILVIS